MTNTFYDALNAQNNFTGNWYEIITSYKDVNSTAVTDLTTATSHANTDLATLNVDLSSNIAQQNIVLTQQQNVKRILDREQKRLNQKQDSVDTVIQGQKRIAELNDSYTARYQAYNRVLIFITIMAAILVIVFLLAKTGRIPETIVNIVVAVVIGVTIIALYYMIRDIARRDNMNFNKLGYGQTMSPQTAAALATSGDGTTSIFMNNLGVCYGSSCCSSDTSYNLTTGLCELKTSSFVNIEDAYNGNDLGLDLRFNGGSNIGAVAPNLEGSSINYSVLK